jgi:hypothetical protein
MSDQIIRDDQDAAATPGLEGPMCYGYTRGGVWLDTRYGWVIPDDAMPPAELGDDANKGG